MILLLLNCFLSTFAWTPIGSIYNLPRISPITINDKEYAIWKTSDNIPVVNDNICPHRLAPLTEGRIVCGNCIQCCYHGWQFNQYGECVSIPQNDTSNMNISKFKIKTYKTKITGDILWALLDDKIKTNITNIENDSILMNSDIPYIREVPYSWNFLLENFFDPAHIPFAHHGLQSVREDAGPIPIKLLTFTKDKLEVSFLDKVLSKKRVAKIVYNSPFIYKLYKQHELNNLFTTDLTILCVPITTGRTRVFMCYKKNNDIDSTDDKAVVARVKSHKISNYFFNTDDYLVHKQEINKGKGYNYTMPTRSDYAVKILHSWIDAHYPQWKFQNTKELTKEEATDNKKNHENFCLDCKINSHII